jgi:hypothetical protein
MIQLLEKVHFLWSDGFLLDLISHVIGFGSVSPFNGAHLFGAFSFTSEFYVHVIISTVFFFVFFFLKEHFTVSE